MKTITFLFSIMAVFLFSCEPEAIVGPEGPQGEQGPMGADGKDGADGEDGNANVQSITKSVASSDWIPDGTSGEDLYFYYEISVPEITSEIAESGLVLVYAKGSEYYTALPAVFYFYSSYSDVYYQSTIRYHYGVGKVRLEIEDSDLVTYRPEFTMTFKIVIVDGVLSASINLNDYNSVKELF